MGLELNEQQLRGIQLDLEQLQQQLTEQLLRIDEDSRPVQLDQQTVGRLSRMDAMQQQQMAQASRTHMQAHLTRVNLALQAIAGQDYGYCKNCEEAIGFPRLKICPDSQLCVACQQRSEL